MCGALLASSRVRQRFGALLAADQSGFVSGACQQHLLAHFIVKFERSGIRLALAMPRMLRMKDCECESEREDVYSSE